MGFARLGTRGQQRGALYSDIWRGPASNLAGLGIPVFVLRGLLETLVKQQRFKDDVRYSLVVSIKTQQCAFSTQPYRDSRNAWRQ